METITTRQHLTDYINQIKLTGQTIGFIPTMGYLHEGHLSLIQRAQKENDNVIVSVYVNPTQFGPDEDLATYPRDERGDRAKMAQLGVDACFFPNDQMMYPEGFQTYIENQGYLADKLCGAKRPGHFRGVTTIVGKLFNLVRPDRAYFGMKDAQQVAVIQKMVTDLHFPVQIVPCPILREADGLAMSSRNQYLSAEARHQALALKSTLDLAESLIAKGARSAAELKRDMQMNIEKYSLAKIDYIEIVDAQSLQDIEILDGVVLIALAVYVDDTRLIDNTLVEV